MNDTSSDEILLLKQRLAEQEALNLALLEKLADQEREIDHLQAQLDKLRRMNFGNPYPSIRLSLYAYGEAQDVVSKEHLAFCIAPGNVQP